MRRIALSFLLAVCVSAMGQSTATLPATKPAADPAEYARRAAALKEDDVDGRLALARWARDRQMWPEAVDMAEAVLYRDPGNRAAYLVLQQVDEGRPLAEEPGVEQSLKAEFKARFNRDFKVRTSKHFLFVYDTTDAFAIQRATVMERIYESFQFYFVMSTLRPEFLSHRLIVILFTSRNDYLSYLKQSERNEMTWSAGFFSQRTNRSAYFDDTSGSTAASYAQQAETLRQKMDDLTKQLNAAAAKNESQQVARLTVERGRVSDELSKMNTRAGNAILMMNNSKTMHEAAHQVAFNIGVQSRLVDYPLWFSEGLACSFETEDALGHKGPAVLNYGRVAGIKELLRANKLMPIEDFVRAGGPEKQDVETLTLFYSEGWGLFHYLYRFQRAGMEKYILAYKAQPVGRRIEADERVQLFKEAFGEDLEGLNKKFMAYMKGIPAAPPQGR